jgi:UDP-N-acetylmuramoyl-tripeptide--D-alanyl-D-alanine ligase
MTTNVPGSGIERGYTIARRGRCVRFSTTELATHLGGSLSGPDVTVDGAGIDSRTIAPGQLFVPVVAERDGHAFIGAALSAGAAAYLTAEGPVGGSAVAVEDTGTALMQLGVLARSRVSTGVVGITGSVGKTTTKDLLRHCLASTFRTAASERSFNNELGLPLTLLNAPDDAQWVVLEMGARDVGHIARLALVGRPDVGIVTSVAMAHVEFFGGLDGVARAKGELVRALPESGVAVLNFDDARVAAMASYSPCPVLGYAVPADAEVRAEAVALDDDLRARFTLVTPWGRGEVRLSLHGLQQVPNALAAASAALWCGVPFDAVLAALAEATGSPFRMEVHRTAGGPLLLADCYNANPASTEAALHTLGLVQARRKLALLGLMAELGAATEAEHLRVASLAEELGIEVVGYQTDLYGEAHVDDVDGAVALLRTLGPAEAALVKGSRVARLEDVVLQFEAGPDQP